MKINRFQGDVTDISSQKEALMATVPWTLFSVGSVFSHMLHVTETGRSIDAEQCFCLSQNIGQVTQETILLFWEKVFIISKYPKCIQFDILNKINDADELQYDSFKLGGVLIVFKQYSQDEKWG